MSTAAPIQILDCDPDLGEELSREDLAVASQTLVADTASYVRGPWTVRQSDFGRAAILLVVEGLGRVRLGYLAAGAAGQSRPQGRPLKDGDPAARPAVRLALTGCSGRWATGASGWRSDDRSF